MLDPAEIERALLPLLPAASSAQVAALARLLADAANRGLAQDELQRRLMAEPELGPLLQQLAGQQIKAGDALLSIEQASPTDPANSTSSGIRIGVGRAPDEQSGVRQQGAFISGGTINGVVVGVNAGTINYTEIKVNVHTGTILNPAEQPTIVRCAPPRPPLPLRRFYDRADALDELQAELQPRGGAWLTGKLGAGVTALLHQIANSSAAQSLADGVLYVDGASKPADADDIVQSLYSSFYKRADGAIIRPDPGTARSEIGNIQALFLLDRLRLDGAALAGLADTLAGSGAVLVAAEGPAPDTLLDLPLDGLPRADALKLCATEARLDASPPEVAALLERLCATIGYLPLPLLLAARLLRANIVPLERLVEVAEELRIDREPLARAPNSR